MTTQSTSLLKRLAGNRLLWPIVGVLLLLVINLLEFERVEGDVPQRTQPEAVQPSKSVSEPTEQVEEEAPEARKWSVEVQGIRISITTRFFKINIKEKDNGEHYFYGNLVDIVKWASLIMALAFGMTLVIGTGGIDLSVGSMMAVSGAIGALLVTQTNLPFGLVVAIALGACALAGMWNGFLIGYVGIQPFVATLILMVAGRGVALWLCGSRVLRFYESKPFAALYGKSVLMMPLCVWIVLALFIITVAATRKTAIGLFIESVGNNETASRYAGINARMVKVLVYGFCSMCAGVSGLIAASSITGADSNKAGLMYELYAIFAVVVGGTTLSGGRFSLTGSVIGAILFKTLENTMYAHGVPSDVMPAYVAVVIIFVCLLQSEEFRSALRRRFGRITGSPKGQSA